MRKKVKLSGSETGWQRCGNTPFYRRVGGTFPASYYTDPFNWTQISVGGLSEPGPFEGYFDVLYRRAPRYDWDTLKAGIGAVTNNRQEQLRVLRLVHEWGTDLFKAKSAKLAFRDLRKMFEAAPREAQDAVLEGVGALLQGDIEAQVYKAVSQPEVEEEGRAHLILVVLAGSLAEKNLEEVRTFFTAVDRVIVAENVEKGMEEALEYFGILEC